MQDQQQTPPEQTEALETTNTPITPGQSSAPVTTLVPDNSLKSLEPSQPNTITLPPTKKSPLKRLFGSRRNKLISLAVLLLMVAGAAGGYAMTQNSKNNKPAAQATSNMPSTDVQKNTTDVPANKEQTNITTQNGLNLLKTAKKIPSLEVFKDYMYLGNECPQNENTCSPTYTANDFSYYQVGTTKDNQSIVVMYAKAKNIASIPQYVLLWDGAQKITLLAHHNYGLKYTLITSKSTCSDCLSDLKKALETNVQVDTTTQLADLLFPKEVVINSQKFKIASEESIPSFMPNGLSDILLSDISNITSPKTSILGTSGDYTMHRIVKKDGAGYSLTTASLTIGELFTTTYSMQGEFNGTTDALTIKWTAGEQNTSKYFSGGPGCGGGGYVTGTDLTESDLMQVGTSKAGQKLYQLKDTSRTLFKTLYNDDYKPEQKTSDNYVGANLIGLSAQEFTDKHAYFIVKNGMDDYQVFQRGDMFTRGGCGKPVVYLYPTEPMTVSVAVGADVVVSEPNYPIATGWQNVFAQPSGQLTYQGKSYNSLYWEGYGHGSYPDITQGTIVREHDAAKTIRTQLAQQGFVAHEIDDFMAYWQPKLPTTPYVRLTWFGTPAMNRLAPLSVTPMPQTVLRTFLDFEGLQMPINLPKQSFTAPERKGFTLVEWGGLLRGGIQR